MKIWSLCIFSICLLQTVYSQDVDYSDIDSRSLSYVDSTQLYMPVDLDIAMVYADSAYALKPQITSQAVKVKVITNLGDVYGEIADMDMALKYFLEAKSLLNNLQIDNPDDEELTLSEIDILIKIAVLNFHIGFLDKSLAQNEEALSKLEREVKNGPKEEIALKKIRLFNNIAGVYLQNLDFNTALAYYQNALEINKTIDNKNYEANLENNLGICNLEMGEYDLANHHFLKSLSLHKQLGNKRGEAQTLNSIGKNQATKGNFNAAKNYFEEALSLGFEIGNGKSILISLESLALVYDTLGEYKLALNTFKEYKALNDSIFSADSQTAMAKLEDSFRRDKEKKLFEIEAHREKAERQKAELRNLKIGAALLSLLLLALLLIVFMRGKIRAGKLHEQKLKLEHEKLELERRTLQESLDFKDRELTANALFLVKNNELISKITEKLLQAKSTFKQENQKIIQDIIFELRSSQDKNLWDEFEAHFTHVHSDFYQKLQEKFPNLTANEKKLCAFLRLNMSTKDISAITYQSINSITVARSRLRKKLNIEGEDIHLVNFLLEF